MVLEFEVGILFLALFVFLQQLYLFADVLLFSGKLSFFDVELAHFRLVAFALLLKLLLQFDTFGAQFLLGLFSNLQLEIKFIRDALVKELSPLRKTLVTKFKANFFAVRPFRTIFQEIVLEILYIRLEHIEL